MIRDIAEFRAAYHSSAADYDHTGHLVTMPTDLPWISGGSEQEWLIIDLGTVSELYAIEILWGETAARSVIVEVAYDRENWKETLELTPVYYETSRFEIQSKGRFVRLTMQAALGEKIAINRVRIIGENNLKRVHALSETAPPSSEDKQILSGSDWQLIRASEVLDDGCKLSGKDAQNHASIVNSGWLPTVVPGTVLNSFLIAGAIPDPLYDDDQFQISEAYFTADFWYRKRFKAVKAKCSKRVFLEFDKINWKADVFLNGVYLNNSFSDRNHSIEGAFIRAQFDVTEILSWNKENVLAVRILKNETPGAVTTQGLAYGPAPNGGALGADNPTFHASIGWDWLPTIRGRNTGIIGDVSLHFCEDLQIRDPWMETELQLISESVTNPIENLMLRASVRTDGQPGPVHDWHGKKGSCFTVDFGSLVPISSVSLLWGTESSGRSADYESRYAKRFSLEVSRDGIVFCNLDAFPGGQVVVSKEFTQYAPANAGTAVYSGHAFSDTIPGATALVNLDPSYFGPEAGSHSFVEPQKIRFLRFTVLAQREENGCPLDTIVKQIEVYSDSPKQIEQATLHDFVLNTGRAELTLHADIRNDTGKEANMILSGRILPDGPFFSEKKTIPAETLSEIAIPFSLNHPKLWWPNTYGEPFLYTCEMELSYNDRKIDSKQFQFGVRRFDYPVERGLLTLYCNGVRILAKGGNWGMDDGLKRDTEDVYYDKVRLHAEANMTMIRNWVGMTDHKAFYDACDRFGILIWDDFWLANPWDGPPPRDPDMFLQNAADKIRKVRSHPSLVFYCGRNEGYPPEQLDQQLKELTEKLDGTRFYFPHSAAAPVSSGGGYSLAKAGQAYGIKQYFDDVSSSGLRSERGIPNVPELESARKFVRPKHLWPINETWALHDWTYHANGPANTYMETLQNYLGGDFEVPVDRIKEWTPDENDPAYLEYKASIAEMCKKAGEVWSVEDFFQAAQLINYDHHRGLFESISARLSNGLLMWMSQSSWPSFMWQTYDYYLYTNGGYFGSKAGNQATRAFFDPRSNRILLSNATPNCFRNMTVTEEMFNLYGKPVHKEEYHIRELRKDAYGISAGTIDFSLSDTDVLFLRLTLRNRGGEILGQNTYWHNRKEYQNYKALRSIPKTRLSVKKLGYESVKSRQDEKEMIRIKLEIQNGEYPALNTRIRLMNENQEDVLPVFFSDNYLLLMPHEARQISAEYVQQSSAVSYIITAWNSEE